MEPRNLCSSLQVITVTQVAVAAAPALRLSPGTDGACRLKERKFYSPHGKAPIQITTHKPSCRFHLRSQGKGKRRGQEMQGGKNSDGKISDRQGTWGEEGMVALYLINRCGVPFRRLIDSCRAMVLACCS